MNDGAGEVKKTIYDKKKTNQWTNQMKQFLSLCEITI